MASIAAGIGWHILGAGMAASFYAPIEKVRKWSWETTWAIAGFFSWILLPIGVSLLLLPDFGGFYASMPVSLLLKEGHFEQKGYRHRRVEPAEVRQQKQAHTDGKQYPREEARDGPRGFPRPLPHLFDRRIE